MPPGAPLSSQDSIFEILEEIEGTTSEIHRRTLGGGEPESRLASEATRLASESERLVMRRASLEDPRVLAGLEHRRDRLRMLLDESGPGAIDTAIAG